LIYRKARIDDVECIHRLLTLYANEGLLLARSRAKLYEGIREFSVAEQDGEIIGTGSLHIMWKDLAEIRSLAVSPTHTRQGIGKKLVNIFLEEAKNLCIPRVFTLTYKPGFFERCGFTHIEKDDLPQKVWRECVDCPHFPNCEEVAMIITLNI